MIGEHIGQYRIDEEIGRGAMGVVYRGTDTKLDRQVALKFVQFSGADARKQMDRLIREAKSLAAVEHPNICPIFNVIDQEEQACIVMAYIEGESLAQLLDREEGLDPKRALDIAAQTARGMRAAHQKGIIHRDLKPENIMLTEEDRVLVMDFGVARRVGSTMMTVEGGLTGTAAYMAPEQWRGEEVDARTDAWALGVILHQMVTGGLPFAGEYPEAVMYSVMNREPGKLPGSVDATVRAVHERCLQKDPAHRFPDFQVLIDTIEGKGGPTIKGPATISWGWLLLAAALVVMALAALGLKNLLPLGQEPLPHLPAQHVLVTPFVNKTGDPGLDNLSDLAVGLHLEGLAEIEGLEKVTRGGDTGLTMASTVEELAKTARLQECGTVISGSYFLLGEKLVIQTRVTREDLTEMRFSVPNTSGPQENPLELFKQSMDHLKGGLLMTVANPYQEPVSRAPLFEAARAYLNGLHHYPDPKARGFIMTAATLDPLFLNPQIMIVQALRDPEHAVVQKVMNGLEERMADFSPFEQARIKTVRNLLKTNYEGAYAAAKLAHDLEPQDLITATTLIDLAWLTNQPRAGLEVYQDLHIPEELTHHRGLEKLGREICMMLQWVGDYEGLLAESRMWKERFPESNRLFSHEMIALGGMKRYAEMDSVAAAVIGRTGGMGDIPYVLEHGLRILAIQGKFGWARRIADRGLNWIATQDEGHSRQGAFYAGYMLQHCDRWAAVDSIWAVNGFHDEVAESPAFSNRLPARAAAYLGDAEKALSIMDLAYSYEKSQGGDVARALYEKACVLGILGRKEEAVSLLLESYRKGWYRSEWVTPDPALQHLVGVADFDNYMNREN